MPPRDALRTDAPLSAHVEFKMVDDNRSILEKADLALAELTTGGGLLLPAQAKKFMRLVVKQSVLLPMVTVVPMAAPKQEINKIRFGARILRPGKEATALTRDERSKPEFSKIELDAKLFKGEVDLPDEVLEDSVEGGELKQTIMELIAERVGRDMEEIVISGNRASTDPFFGHMDGILVQATSHVGDAGGVAVTKDILFDTLKMLPSEYLRDKSAMRWLVSTDTELAYRNKLAERQTVGGDRWLETDVPIMYSGIPFAPIPLWPDKMPAPAAAPPTPGSPTPVAPADRTALVLCNPKNIHVGIWRQIRLETWRDISSGVLKVVVTLRFDAVWADEPGVVKIVNLA